MADHVGEGPQCPTETAVTDLLRDMAESPDALDEFRNRFQDTVERSCTALTPRYQALIRRDDESIAATSRQFEDLSRHCSASKRQANRALVAKQEAEERAEQLQQDLDIAKGQVQGALDSARQRMPGIPSATTQRQAPIEAQKQIMRLPDSEPSDDEDEDEDDGIQFHASVIDPTTRLLDARCPQEVYEEVRNQLLKAKQASGDRYLSDTANRYRCAVSQINNSKCYWSVKDAGLYACKSCTNMKRPCFTVTLSGAVQIRPLPEEIWPRARGASGDGQVFSVENPACFINKTGLSTNRYTYLWTDQPARARYFDIPVWQ